MLKGANFIYQISILRIIAITLLIVTHTFGIYSGAWILPEGLEPNRFLKWIAKGSSGMGVQMMSIIAGYIFAFQYVDNKNKIDIRSFIKKKIVRLLVPCILFGTIYHIIFIDNQSSSYISVINRIFNGVGHLWFLPTLFWSYIILWCIHRFQLNKYFTGACLLVFYYVDLNNLPLGLNSINYVTFFMYLGYLIRCDKNFSFTNRRISLAPLYLLASIAFIYSKDHFTFLFSLGDFDGMIKPTLDIIIALLRFFGLYIVATFLCGYLSSKQLDLVNHFSKNCYGIYLFHQFILLYIYYKTPLCLILHNDMASFINLNLTMILSLFITTISCRTMVGKRLIG